MSEEISLPKQDELAQYPKWQEYLQPVIAQLEKDFQTSGLEWNPGINSASDYFSLSEKLIPHINRLLDRHYESLLQLLYRVDISEAQLKKAVSLYPEKPYPQMLAELIILRELYKVLLRTRYS